MRASALRGRAAAVRLDLDLARKLVWHAMTDAFTQA